MATPSPYRSSVIGTKFQRSLSTVEADRALQAMARDELVGIYPSYDPRDDVRVYGPITVTLQRDTAPYRIISYELDHYLLRFDVECAVPREALIDDSDITVSVVCGVAVHSSGEAAPEMPKRSTEGIQESAEDEKSCETSCVKDASILDEIATQSWTGPLETWPGTACWLWTERTAYGGHGRRGTRRHRAGGDAVRSRLPNKGLLTSPRLNDSSDSEEVTLVRETWEILVHGDVCEWSVISNSGQVRSEVLALNRSDGFIYIFNLSCSSSDKLHDVDVTMRDIEIVAIDTADEFFTRVS